MGNEDESMKRISRTWLLAGLLVGALIGSASAAWLDDAVNQVMNDLLADAQACKQDAEDCSALAANKAAHRSALPTEIDTNEAAWRIDGTAAQVNDDVITIAEAFSSIDPADWRDLPNSERRDAKLKELYNEALDFLIERKLILSVAKAEERKVQDWVVGSQIQEIIDNRFHGDRQLLLTTITQQHLSYAEWARHIGEDLLCSAMRNEYVDRRVSISPLDIRSYYETNSQSLASASVHVAMITLSLFDKTPEGLAAIGTNVLQELDAGADFAAVAKKYSTDSRAATGGDRGFVEPADMFVPGIVKALNALKPGQYSRVIVIGEQAFIVKKIEEKAAMPPTLEEAWPMIERRLRARQAAELHREWAARLREKAYVQIFELPGPMGRK
jgi:gas vesicle protein